MLILIRYTTIIMVLMSAAAAIAQPTVKKNNDEILINQWLDLARDFENENMDSAAYYYQKGGALADRVNSYDGKMKYAFGYSVVLNAKSNFSESEKILRQALALARKNEDALNTAKALVNVGNVFNYKGLFDSAYVYYVEAIPFLKKADATHFLDILYSNIGVLLENAGRDEEAILYYDKGYAIAAELNDSARMATVLNNKGIVLNSLRRLEDAIATFKKAVELAGEDLGILGSAYSNLANAYQLKKQNEPALMNYKKALQIFEKLGDDGGRGQALIGHAIVYFNLNNPLQAEKFAEEALRYLQAQPASRLELYKLLADIKFGLNKHAESRDFFSKYIDLQKEIQGQEIQETIINAEKKFQLAQKEEELAVKELQLTRSELNNRKKNSYLIITAVIILALVVISFLFFRNIRQRNKLFEIERDNLEKEKEVSVLKANIDGAQAERSRIAKELHDDLGTGLTSIRFLAERMARQNDPEQKEDAGKIRKSAQTLTEQMNEIVWSMNTESDSLADLLIYMRAKVAAFLDENETEFSFQVPSQIPDKKVSGFFRRNVYLVVKEATHNAVKHSGTTRVDVWIKTEPELVIHIKDYGAGMPSGNDLNTGHGIRNMKQRVLALGGRIEINQEDGTIVTLTVPYIET